MNTKRIANTLKLVVGLIAERRFYDLYVLDEEKAVPPENMPLYLDDYGGEITLPEGNDWHYDFYPVDGTEEIFIDYDLLIDGKISDLTLQISMTDDGISEFCKFSFQSMHML